MASKGSKGGLASRHLQAAEAEFELCARRAIECILGSPTLALRKFRQSPRPLEKSSVRCLIRAGNAEYLACLSLGLEPSDFGKILPGRPDEEVADAIGEVSNVIAGTFMGRPAFLEAFGHMLPSPPVFADCGDDTRGAWSVQGLLAANGARLFLNITVKSNEKEIPK